MTLLVFARCYLGRCKAVRCIIDHTRLWSMPRPKLCFGEFELDPERYQLRRSGRVTKLENKPLDLLIFLVERAGTLVSREEIAQRLWTDGVFVDTKHGINTAVKKIRT